MNYGLAFVRADVYEKLGDVIYLNVSKIYQVQDGGTGDNGEPLAEIVMEDGEIYTVYGELKEVMARIHRAVEGKW